MAPLTAAQIEDAVVALEPDAADQQVDFIGRIAVVLDDVAVGFEVEGIEQGTPPVGRQVTFEIGDRAQSTGTNAPVRFGMGEIRVGRTGLGQVSLGGGPRTVGFLPHTVLPRLSGNQKSGFPLRGPAEQECLVGWHQHHRSRPSARSGAGIRWSVVSVERFRRTVVQASSGEERMVAQKFGSGLANNASRREVRNKSRSFQGGIYFCGGISRPVPEALRDRGSRRPATRARDRIGRHGPGCNWIVPSRTPVARSITRSCRLPSGSASAITSRSGPTVIASMRASRGMSIDGLPNARVAVRACPPRGTRPAMTTTRAAKPTTSITPITPTRTLSARIGLELDRHQIRPTDEAQGYKAPAPAQSSLPFAALPTPIHILNPAP